MGKSISWHHSPFDLQGAFLYMCSQGGLLTSRMRNTWSLLFCLDSVQPPLSTVVLFPSQSPQGMSSNRLPWGPIFLLRQVESTWVGRCCAVTTLDIQCTVIYQYLFESQHKTLNLLPVWFYSCLQPQ